MYLGAALLAVPGMSYVVAGTVLRDTGVTVIGGATTAVVVAALVFVWRAIRTSNRVDTQAVVRDELRAQLEPLLKRLDHVERRLDDERHGR